MVDNPGGTEPTRSTQTFRVRLLPEDQSSLVVRAAFRSVCEAGSFEPPYYHLKFFLVLAYFSIEINRPIVVAVSHLSSSQNPRLTIQVP